MAGLDEVLQRLAADDRFARQLANDPKAALAGYDLTTEELRVLERQLDHPGDGRGFAALFEAD
jgi:hypothetical protein